MAKMSKMPAKKSMPAKKAAAKKMAGKMPPQLAKALAKKKGM